MPERNPPWAVDGGGNHAAEDIRQILYHLTNGHVGVMGSSDLAVTAQGTPARSVNVAFGGVLMPGSAPGVAGPFYGYSTTNVVVTTAPGDASNPRDDIIVAKFDHILKVWSIVAVQGTPNAVPVDPTLPDNCTRLARVRIQTPPNDTVTTGDITDLRSHWGLWSTYSPTWGGAGVSLGNGTLTGRFRLIGRTLSLSVRLLLGSTSNVGTGIWTFTLPSGLVATRNALLPGMVSKASANSFPALGQLTGSNFSVLVPSSATATFLAYVKNDMPAGAWATNDSVQIDGTFEVN